MFVLKPIAERVAVRANPKKTFDPATILLILEILQKLLPYVIEICEVLPDLLPQRCRNVTWFERRVLAIKIWQVVGRDYWSLGGTKLIDAMLEEGTLLDGDQVQEAYAEAKGLWL